MLAEVSAGRMTDEQVEAALDATVEAHKDNRARTLGCDSDGDPIVPLPELAAIRSAFKVMAGDESMLMSTAIADYLKETQARVTKAAQHAKTRRLNQFLTWLGGDREVKEVTRMDAGRYLNEVLLPMGNTAKTTKDHIGDLSAFWN